MRSRLDWTIFVVAALTFACSTKEGEACLPGDCASEMVCEGSPTATCKRCSDTVGCHEHGECSFDAELHRCSPMSREDCAQSEDCKKRLECTPTHQFGKAVCGLPPILQDNKEGGCPCGCDHSQAMVTELRTQDRDEALTTARRSLATISERERLGYITDAMVSHRLRLRGLESTLLGPDEGAFESALSPSAVALRERRAELPIRHVAGLSVQSELVVYGATSETIRGEPKELRACFREWMLIENEGPEGKTLALPSLHGSAAGAGKVTFDVRRWYLEDSDGEPWDGVLEPGSKHAVLVIGYLGEQLAPGLTVDATLQIAGVELADSVVTLGRWDARDPALQ